LDEQPSGSACEVPHTGDVIEPVQQPKERLIQQVADQHAALLQVAARLVGRNDAPDVAQEAFISLTRWIRGQSTPDIAVLLGSPTALRKIMYVVTARRAFDFWRRVHQDRLTDDRHSLDAAVDDTTRTAETDVVLARLERAYAGLSPGQRIAHVLHHYYGFTDSELAVALKIEKTTSRTLVHRANRDLRRAMEMKK
jgi:RNA polymerase sigma factor (sigma-70 family)